MTKLSRAARSKRATPRRIAAPPSPAVSDTPDIPSDHSRAPTPQPGRQLRVWVDDDLAALLDQRVGREHGERSAFVRTALRRALRNTS